MVLHELAQSAVTSRVSNLKKGVAAAAAKRMSCQAPNREKRGITGSADKNHGDNGSTHFDVVCRVKECLESERATRDVQRATAEGDGRTQDASEMGGTYLILARHVLCNVVRFIPAPLAPPWHVFPRLFLDLGSKQAPGVAPVAFGISLGIDNNLHRATPVAVSPSRMHL